MKKVIAAMVALVLLTGCDSYVDRIKKDPKIENVMQEDRRGYIMYDLKGENVRCREHIHRSELTCWVKEQ